MRLRHKVECRLQIMWFLCAQLYTTVGTILSRKSKFSTGPTFLKTRISNYMSKFYVIFAASTSLKSSLHEVRTGEDVFIHPYICSLGLCPKLKGYTTNSNKFHFNVCRYFQSHTKNSAYVWELRQGGCII